jgi:nitroreductase
MELFDAIITRRSIRKYKDKIVPPELIEKILTAAMYAPSANNYQPWQFIVINERSILNEIPVVQPYSKMLYTATLGILICGDENYEKLPGYNAVNCSAATQNLLLAAHDCGLGTCWIGIYPREERMAGIKKLLKLPENIVPISLIAVGYPDEARETTERFIPSRIHYNGW